MTLEPLKITCTSTRCEDGLHCYRQKRAAAGQMSGPCRDCGADLVPWERVHARALGDVAHTFAALKTELIRHEFWHRELDEQAVRHAQRKGRIKLRAAAEHRIRKYLAPADLYRDGTQTALSGNVIYYAQHATATCCRKCAEEWHAIPQGRAMTEDEIAYCMALVWAYIEERLPDLAREGIAVPRQPAQPSVREASPEYEASTLGRVQAAMRVKQGRRRNAEH